MDRRLMFVLAGIILFALYALASSPDSVVVSTSGDIEGGINKARSILQGKGFWEKQLELLEEEHAFAKAWPTYIDNMQRDLEDSLEPILQDTNNIMEELYNDMPELRPTAAEQRAEMLRQNADDIEAEELNRSMRRVMNERASELNTIRPLIMSQLQ